MKQVGIWDTLIAGQPTFAKDHPLLSKELAIRIANYLDRGVIMLHTTKMKADLFDPQANLKVSCSMRTDGEWIWEDAVGYYVRHYLLAPDENFMSYLKSRDYISRTPNETEISSVLSEFLGKKPH